MDWEKLYKKQIEPFFKPSVTGPKDLRYFDKIFTDVPPIDSIPENSLNSVQKASNTYDGFTYTEQTKFT
jgi:Protein kinase C terminal domain